VDPFSKYFGLVVAPNLAALTNESDMLVAVTAGGPPVEAIPGSIPANARLAAYLPFEWILSKAAVFVTNGGYGSVNQAMSFGVPLVTAGLTEDKADVNARVGWPGVGIDLATNAATQHAVRNAVRTALDTRSYRRRARRWRASSLPSTPARRSSDSSGKWGAGNTRKPAPAAASRLPDSVSGHWAS
jgi:UDP:flavonoid glycosyltransferase YjiC (YdhE family)